MSKKPAEPKPERKTLITDQDVETFGEDLINLQTRVAKEVGTQYEDDIQSLRESNQELWEKLQRADFAYVNKGTLEELDEWVVGVMRELTA